MTSSNNHDIPQSLVKLLDQAREESIRNVRRQAHAVMVDTPKAVVDIGVTIMTTASAIVLKYLIEQLCIRLPSEAPRIPTGTGLHPKTVALSLESPPHIAYARPIYQIIQETLTVPDGHHRQEWRSDLDEILKQLVLHPAGEQEDLARAILAIKKSTGLIVLQREATRPHLHLDEQEEAKLHVRPEVIALRAAAKLDKLIPLPNSAVLNGNQIIIPEQERRIILPTDNDFLMPQ